MAKITQEDLRDMALEVLDLIDYNRFELSAACEEYASLSGLTHKQSEDLYDLAQKIVDSAGKPS